MSGTGPPAGGGEDVEGTAAAPRPGDPPDGEPPDGGVPDGGVPDGAAGRDGQVPDAAVPPAARVRRRRDRLAGALIGVLTLVLGFALAVQVRTTDTGEVLAGAREEDLVRILDDLDDRERRLRQQVAEQRGALAALTSSDSRSATALAEARERTAALGVLAGTLAAEGPGLRISIGDPQGQIRVADLVDAVQELRGAGAETMQVDGVRVGVDTAVTGRPGELRVDGRPVSAPYEFVVIGAPQYIETALNIPGGVVQRIAGRGGTVSTVQSDRVVVDALRPLDAAQYAAPDTEG